MTRSYVILCRLNIFTENILTSRTGSIKRYFCTTTIHNCEHTMIGYYSIVAMALLGVVVGVDRTLSPGANGQVVVEAVVDRIRANCIFGDDRLFLRRLAYVETSDGEDSKTYRSGYDGGIWQIDEDKFNSIPSCSHYRIREKCSLISSSFNINWSTVTWADLRKPLYSGLAAALYIQSLMSTPPTTIVSQASFWSQYLRNGGQTSDFTTKASNLPGSDCETELDLAFIIDGSGSVSYSDFSRMLTFIQDVVRNLNVNEEEVHVAALEYSTEIGTTITFNNFTDKSNLITSIGNIVKGNRGTGTHLAIENTVSVLFNQSTGARANAKRVAILLTDGVSNNKTATLIAAAAAKAQGITMFSVGVGNINEDEIEAIATSPNCTHVFILSNFQEIDSLLYELKDSSCSAATNLPGPEAKQEITKSIPENKTITETYVAQQPTGSGGSDGGSDGGTTTDETGEQRTIVKSEVQCGSLEIYASYNTPRPGPAFYDIRDSAREGAPSIIYLNTTVHGRPLYITVIGSRLPKTVADVTSCLDSSYTVSVTTAPIKASVVCRVGQTERTCTEDDFLGSPYSDLLCEDSWNDIINPCTAGRVAIHAHPSDLTKFIRCDVTGKMYVTQCPMNETFNANTESCSHQAIGGNNGTPLPVDLTSHCTADNLAMGKFYFPYPGDKAKFVRCDVWGRAWVKLCPDDFEWDDTHSTCSKAAESDNPCTNDNNGSMFPHSESNKFITCANGRPVVTTCAGALVYNSQSKACDWPQNR